MTPKAAAQTTNPFHAARSKDEFRLVMMAYSADPKITIEETTAMLDLYRALPDTEEVTS